MKFRFGLPVLQLVTSLLILWAPWVPGAHKIDVGLRDGREFTGWTILPNPIGFDAVRWAQAINLPAILAEIPVDLVSNRVRKDPSLPDRRMQFFLFVSLGFFVWYLLGRFLEDFVHFRRTGLLPSPRLIDTIFAFEAAVVATLSVLVVLVGGVTDFPLLTWSSVVWFAMACVVLTVRLMQFIPSRHAKAKPSPIAGNRLP